MKRPSALVLDRANGPRPRLPLSLIGREEHDARMADWTSALVLDDAVDGRGARLDHDADDARAIAGLKIGRRITHVLIVDGDAPDRPRGRQPIDAKQPRSQEARERERAAGIDAAIGGGHRRPGKRRQRILGLVGHDTPIRRQRRLAALDLDASGNRCALRRHDDQVADVLSTDADACGPNSSGAPGDVRATAISQ